MTTILTDQAIPYLDQVTFSHPGIVIKSVPAHAIRSELYNNRHSIEALVVRSVTSLNAKILQNTAVRWVASATSGADHIDQHSLKQQGIDSFIAKGCNAQAVAEYVLCTIAYLQQLGKLSQKPKIGIIGAGHVGQALQALLQLLGCDLVLYDPPRAERELDFQTALQQELMNCDLLSLHVPLITSGPHATESLLDQRFLMQLKPGTVILNASRGAVLPSEAILACDHLSYVLDVWQSEPQLSEHLLAAQQVLLLTPHIAGYGQMAKYRASQWCIDYLARQLGSDYEFPAAASLEPLNASQTNSWQQAILLAYNPLSDDQHLREFAKQASSVEGLRTAYALRVGFERELIPGNWSVEDRAILAALGFKMPSLLP